MNETAQAVLMRKFLDTYGRWFPSHVKDKELWATVKRGILEMIEKYPDEAFKHVGLFDRACRESSVSRNENLGSVLESFQTRVISAENEEMRERMKRALPRVSTAGTVAYAARLSKIQAAYAEGRITRGQRIAAIERTAREDGMSESDVEELVGAAREQAKGEPGGLDGTISTRGTNTLGMVATAIHEVQNSKAGENVESKRG